MSSRGDGVLGAEEVFRAAQAEKVAFAAAARGGLKAAAASLGHGASPFSMIPASSRVIMFRNTAIFRFFWRFLNNAKNRNQDSLAGHI